MPHEPEHRGGPGQFGAPRSGQGGPPASPAGAPFGAEPTWTFAIGADMQTVTGASVGFGDVTKSIDISDITFATVTGINDLGVEAVVAVSETRVGDFGTHTSMFSDQDGDGLFSRTLDLHVVSDGDRLRTHTFTFDSDGNVTGEDASAPLSFGWASHAVYEKVLIDDAAYVVTTVERGDQYAFEISRDDNGDGVWTVIATGVADASTVGGSDLIALDDIAIYMAAASSVIG
jgi:hypothetical protein